MAGSLTAGSLTAGSLTAGSLTAGSATAGSATAELAGEAAVAGGDAARDLADDVLVEEVSIDGMCGVY